MRSKLLLILSLMLATMASAQKDNLAKRLHGTRWTDGQAVYRAEVEGDYVSMAGGTMHEGGYVFGLQCTDREAMDFTLQNAWWGEEREGDGYCSLPCDTGAEVEMRQMDDGHTYLLINDTTLMPVYALRLMKKGEDLRSIIVDNLKRLWCGQYRVAYSTLQQCPTGTLCTLSPKLADLGAFFRGKYEVKDEYESPTNVIRLAKGQYLRILPTAGHGAACGKAGAACGGACGAACDAACGAACGAACDAACGAACGKAGAACGKAGAACGAACRKGDAENLRYGLSLYAVDYNEEESLYTNDRLVMVLDRLPATTPRWPELTSRILLPDEITLHPRSELAVMVNEIYARHGYRFGKPAWQTYFQQESWYEPDSDPDVNNKIHFSAIEQINIYLLRAIQHNQDIYLPQLDEGGN